MENGHVVIVLGVGLLAFAWLHNMYEQETAQAAAQAMSTNNSTPPEKQ